MQKFMETSFIIAKNWEQAKYVSASEEISELWQIHIAIRRICTPWYDVEEVVTGGHMWCDFDNRKHPEQANLKGQKDH